MTPLECLACENEMDPTELAAAMIYDAERDRYESPFCDSCQVRLPLEELIRIGRNYDD